jgi:hypothetical protein
MKKINLEDLEKVKSKNVGATAGEVEECSPPGCGSQEGTGGDQQIKASSKTWDRSGSASSVSAPKPKNQ